MDSSVGIFFHTCSTFYYEPFMSQIKNCQQPYSTVFTRMDSRYTWGWPFFHVGLCLCKLSQRPRLVSRKSAVLQQLQGASHRLRHSVVGKHCVGSLNREWSLHLMLGICFPPETTTVLFSGVCADCVGLTEGGRTDMLCCYGKCFPPSAALRQSAATGD